MSNSKLSSKDIFINEVMLRAAERRIPVTRKEIVECIAFNMALGNYMNIDLILNMINLANAGGF